MNKFVRLLIAIIVNSVLTTILTQLISTVPEGNTQLAIAVLEALAEIPGEFIFWGTVFWAFFNVDVIQGIRKTWEI